MPELPEVETVRRGLAPVMEGSRLVGVDLARNDLRFPFPPNLANIAKGTRFTALSRKGKYLICDLDNQMSIIIHLGMSGSMRIEHNDRTSGLGRYHFRRRSARKHDHVCFRLETTSGPKAVILNDPRRFGFVDLCVTKELSANRFIANLGIDPLGNALSASAIATLFRDRVAPLKSALLDQKLIAGLGNIYVCEALWKAKLSPMRPAGSIVQADGQPGAGCHRLAEAIPDILHRAIKAGGSSLRDHRQADGELGYFQHSFVVYDRADTSCLRPRCKGVIERSVQSGRSTFWCPNCQRS